MPVWDFKLPSREQDEKLPKTTSYIAICIDQMCGKPGQSLGRNQR